MQVVARLQSARLSDTVKREQQDNLRLKTADIALAAVRTGVCSTSEDVSVLIGQKAPAGMDRIQPKVGAELELKGWRPRLKFRIRP